MGNPIMRTNLLTTTSLLAFAATGLSALPAAASDGVKLSLGGFLRSAYGFTVDDDGEGELGHDRNLDGVGSDGEIFFLGEVTLDNGVTVGAQVELEAEEDDDQIDNVYAFFKGGFGDFRIGALDGAAGTMYMLPPGSTANFGPYSPNTIGAVLSPGFFDPELSLALQDAVMKLVYFSPEWNGFSFGLSYTPNDDEKTQSGTDAVASSFHPDRSTGSANHNVAIGLHYDYSGDGWGFSLGGAGYWEGDVEGTSANDAEQAAYNLGANVAIGNLELGVASTYLDDFNGPGQHGLLLGAGFAYTIDAWTIGGGYAYFGTEQAGFSDENLLQRAGLDVSYAMATGIDLDAGIFYTWNEAADDAGDSADEYDAFEISIGSSLTF
jgi:outer membrane protein OmpU